MRQVANGLWGFAKLGYYDAGSFGTAMLHAGSKIIGQAKPQVGAAGLQTWRKAIKDVKEMAWVLWNCVQ